jgi:hypothetical protein
MKDETGINPEEDTIVQTILDGNDEDIFSLIREEPSRAGFVQDVQSVKEGLKSIEDEQPPPFVIESIIKKSYHPFFSRLGDLPIEWHKNPYILSFGFVMAIVFFYFFTVFFLKF